MNDILIVLIGLFSLWLFLKYRTKKHRENLVSVFEKSHAKFAVNRKSQAAFQKAAKEWGKKTSNSGSKAAYKAFILVNR